MDSVLSESNIVLNSSVKVVLCNFFTRMLKSRWYLMLEKQSCAKDIWWYFVVAASVCLQQIEESEIWLGQMGQWNLDVGTIDLNDLVLDFSAVCYPSSEWFQSAELLNLLLSSLLVEELREHLKLFERILNPVKLEEYPRKWTKQRSKDRFLFFFPQFRRTSYSMTLPEQALQGKWELFKWKNTAELFICRLIMYSCAEKPSCCNISVISVMVFFFLVFSLTVCTTMSVCKTYV